MAFFGSFETVRELTASPDSAVYQARKQGAPDDETYAVKVVRKISLLQGGTIFGQSTEMPEDRRTEIFKESVDLQKRAAEQSGSIAPVVESGTEAESVWMATRFYPRSILKIIQGRVALNPAALHHILRSVVNGLLALKASCQRSHGNLKPANILFADSPKITDTDMILTDPAPGDASEAGAIERADLKALGTLLYQLVRRKEMSGSADWLILPLTKTPEWTETFGKRADAWLELCNRLLDPAVSVEEFGLEGLARELPRLESKPPVSPRLVLASAAVLALIVGAYVIYTKFSGQSAVLLVASDPGRATVVLNDVPAGETPQNGAGKFKVPVGTNTLAITLAKLGTFKTNVVVGPRQTLDLPVFRFSYNKLEILSAPPGASFTLDNVTNRTPYTDPFRAPGPVSVDLTLDQYDSETLTTNLPGNGELVRLTRTLKKREPGQVPVTFVSRPYRSTVSEAGNQVEPFELSEKAVKNLTPATYTFKAVSSSEHFPPLTREVTVRANTPERVEFAFPNSKVEFICEPRDAKVTANGKSIAAESSNPRSLIAYLPPGPMTFVFERPGYKPYATNLTLVDNGDTSVTVSLTPEVGRMLVFSDPAGAELFHLTNQSTNPAFNLLGRTPGMDPGATPLMVSLPPAQHVFAARHALFGERWFTNTFEAGAEPMRREIRFDYGILRVATDPPGESIQLAGLLTNAGSAAEFRLPPGRAFEVRAAHAFLSPAQATAQVTLGATNALSLRFAHGYLNLTSAPVAGVSFQVKDLNRLIQGAPPTNLLLNPGKAEVVFAWTGTNVLRTNLVEIGAGGLIATNGVDFFNTEPDSITVHVAGGPGPNDLKLVAVPDPSFPVPGGYYVGIHEVTQGQFQDVLGVNPSQHTQLGPLMPVDNVSWDQAAAFCQQLNAKPRTSTRPGLAGQFTLPTTEQWRFYVGNATLADSVTSLRRTAKRTTPEVVGGGRRPNQFGLFDVRGNVWEWCDVPGGILVSIRGGSFEDALETGVFGRLNLDFPANTYDLTKRGEAVKGVGFRVLFIPAR